MTEICPIVEKTIVKLPPINGHREFTRYKISEDGKCGYHAISVWLKKNRARQYEAILATLPNPKPKYPILAYLQDYIKRLTRATAEKENVMNKCGINMKQMTEASKRVENNEWMQTEELSILCCILGVMAYVYDESNPEGLQWTNVDPRNVEETQQKENMIYLYYQRSIHYDLLTPVEIIDLVNEKPSKKKKRSKTIAKRKKKEKPRKSVCDDYGVCVVQFQKNPTISLKF